MRNSEQKGDSSPTLLQISSKLSSSRWKKLCLCLSAEDMHSPPAEEGKNLKTLSINSEQQLPLDVLSLNL